MENTQDLKDYIISALVYPVFLVAVGSLSIIILMAFVIPKFTLIFADLGQAMPLSTKFLLGVSEGLRLYWWVILAVLAALLAALGRYRRTLSGRKRLDALKLRVPIWGELIRKIETARFARTMGVLTQSGVPILQALDLVQNISANIIIKDILTGIHDRVKEGDRLAPTMAGAGVFPAMAIQMITVGEETGKLAEMLLRVADNYEKVVRDLTKRFISFLEPAMILGMGLVVGFIVISMLMAVFSMNDLSF